MKKYFCVVALIKTMGDKEDTFLEDRCKIEAILFGSPKPVPKSKLKKVITKQNDDYLCQLIDDLQNIYEKTKSAIEIVQYIDSVAMIPKKEYLPDQIKITIHSDELLNAKEKEVLSYLAFFQPIEEKDVISTFGKKIKNIVRNLIEKGLIQETNGIYKTTPLFANYFNVPDDIDEIQKRFSNIENENDKNDDLEI